jgi:signal transduction histidine kinase/ActR/RegA family two-component response regulator
LDTPFDIFFHNFIYLNIANFLGMIICYFMERSARWDYFLTRLYNEEKEKAELANLDLEKRVAERTAEILEANRRLMQEMEAHLKSVEEKQQLQVQLQLARKMESLGTLAGGVAHDLNNILSGVVSYPDLMLSEIPADNPIRNDLLLIKKSGEKAAAIVNDLLTLARRGISVSEVINLNLLIEDYLKSPEFSKLKTYHPLVKFHVNLKSGLANMIGSPVHLSKTIMNIVSNAAEAMPDGGLVTISTNEKEFDVPQQGFMRIESGRYIVMEVTDTGVGIPPQDLERIFEPFYSKKVMGRSGTGLGMAVVWGTLQDHKGVLDVKSTLGEGTSFILYFHPTDQAVEVAEKNNCIDTFKGSGESILVVDDVQDQREIASKILTRLGYSVTTCASGEEALRHMQSHSADLVILDMIMAPGIDGLETYSGILKLHPNQKAIIASGFSETDRVKEMQRLGAGEYLRKPYSIEKIGYSVRKALSRESNPSV